MATLRDLGARLSAASTRAEVVSALQTGLSAGPRDLPFALAYLADRKKQTFELAAVHGLDRNAPSADSIIALQEAAGRSLIEKARDGDSVVVDVNPAAIREMPAAILAKTTRAGGHLSYQERGGRVAGRLFRRRPQPSPRARRGIQRIHRASPAHPSSPPRSPGPTNLSANVSGPTR